MTFQAHDNPTEHQRRFVELSIVPTTPGSTSTAALPEANHRSCILETALIGDGERDRTWTRGDGAHGAFVDTLQSDNRSSTTGMGIGDNPGTQSYAGG
jgi:hypothetical protein